MLALLGSLKAKLWIAAGAVLGFLALILRNRHLQYQRDKARDRAKGAEAQLQFEVKADKAEAEIESGHSDLKRQLEQDKAAGEWPRNLRK